MKQVNIEHYIQRDIMRALLAVPTATYSMLKPTTIESNLFLYHLRQLISAGLIEKDDKQYRLTLSGKQFADRTNLETMKARVQPKVVSILVVTDPDGKYLILERRHQPFLGTKGFPSGKVHFGEQLEQSAYRELGEKTGLTASDVTLTLRGNIFMRFLLKDNDEVVNHVIGYVFTGQTTAPQTLDYEQPLFRSFWDNEQVLYEENAFKGHREILALLKQPDYFVETYDFASTY